MDRWLTESVSEEILSVTLFRSRCFGECPEYRVEVGHDETAVWDGVDFVDRIGRYMASLAFEDFDRLAGVINRTGFAFWHDRYVTLVTDCPTYVLTVRYTDREKRVVQYESEEPADFWVIACCIDWLADRAQWHPAREHVARPSGDGGIWRIRTLRTGNGAYVFRHEADEEMKGIARDYAHREITLREALDALKPYQSFWDPTEWAVDQQQIAWRLEEAATTTDPWFGPATERFDREIAALGIPGVALSEPAMDGSETLVARDGDALERLREAVADRYTIVEDDGR